MARCLPSLTKKLSKSSCSSKRRRRSCYDKKWKARRPRIGNSKLCKRRDLNSRKHPEDNSQDLPIKIPSFLQRDTQLRWMTHPRIDLLLLLMQKKWRPSPKRTESLTDGSEMLRPSIQLLPRVQEEQNLPTDSQQHQVSRTSTGT